MVSGRSLGPGGGGAGRRGEPEAAEAPRGPEQPRSRTRPARARAVKPQREPGDGDGQHGGGDLGPRAGPLLLRDPCPVVHLVADERRPLGHALRAALLHGVQDPHDRGGEGEEQERVVQDVQAVDRRVAPGTGHGVAPGPEGGAGREAADQRPHGSPRAERLRGAGGEEDHGDGRAPDDLHPLDVEEELVVRLGDDGQPGEGEHGEDHGEEAADVDQLRLRVVRPQCDLA